jgi:plastocyanin
MRYIRIAMLAALAVLVLAACSSGGGDTTSDPTDQPNPTGASSAPPPASSADLTVTAPVGAADTGFAETALAAPADTPLTITFVNQDAGIPHNVQIFEGTDTTVTAVWTPEGNAMITGDDEAVYEVPALPAGTYTYNCFSHPATMVGTLTVV